METKVTGIVLMALLMQVTVVTGLKCYACMASKDWSTCNDIQKEVTCDASISHCVKMKATATGTLSGAGVDTVGYTKMCSDSCDAKTMSACKSKVKGVSIKCNVNCCKGDLCNGASVPLVSGVIISACALLNAMFALV